MKKKPSDIGMGPFDILSRVFIRICFNHGLLEIHTVLQFYQVLEESHLIKQSAHFDFQFKRKRAHFENY